ncbi:hypothetical protein CSKR_108639 [Clonorchis sinensis]|uniref:Uncharacterized protein n=1 Tax=Clonorchis sinensis TaxID=79923 RepID=A0A3R7FKD4_CLOSI|nr:hypothetical protein CSKR_108639 [Clonorchis sinensis]
MKHEAAWCNTFSCLETTQTRDSTGFQGARWLKWLERKFAARKVRGSNPTSASRLPLSRLGQPGSIPALVLPSGSMAARHRKGVTAEQSVSQTAPYHF